MKEVWESSIIQSKEEMRSFDKEFSTSWKDEKFNGSFIKDNLPLSFPFSRNPGEEKRSGSSCCWLDEELKGGEIWDPKRGGWEEDE